MCVVSAIVRVLMMCIMQQDENGQIPMRTDVEEEEEEHAVPVSSGTSASARKRARKPVLLQVKLQQW